MRKRITSLLLTLAMLLSLVPAMGVTAIFSTTSYLISTIEFPTRRMHALILKLYQNI